VKIIKTDALSGKSIKGWGVDVGVVVDTQISITLIICYDQNDIGIAGNLLFLTTQNK
jgi:hypothetical protein